MLRRTAEITIGGYAGGELFDAVGLRTIAGRGFTEADRHPRPQVAVVNETAAQAHEWAGRGQHASGGAPGPAASDSTIDVRIVGVIEPARRAEDGPGRAPGGEGLPALADRT